ncbi:hypothetical protein U6M53_11880 [Cutibacterium acnes]|uniref:hypothetical protein n=1 Tax=Cutibacterium acnes TaxID=1747 RepID=UPI000E4A858E|nr:hypothetical protein [Cutibacterium acnes]RHV99267.1 hypothetical protein DXA85_12385 [Propionibacterium sp. KPL2009]
MHHRGIAALIAVAALTGCHSAGSTSAPTPTPSTPTTTSASSVSASSSSTPSATPTPSAGAVSAAEAEKVYRTIHRNNFELEKMGGLAPGEPAPLMLTNYASGSALKDYMTFNHKISGLGIKITSGNSSVTAVREKKGDTTHPEAAIALESCEDYSSIRTVDRHGKTDHGHIIHVDSWYTRDKAGTVKMIAFNSVKVPSCDVK